MTDRPAISEREAEELIKGMGRECVIVVHDGGLVTATAISAHPNDPLVQMQLDSLLEDVQRKYRIVKKSYR
jgi:hypothetical protein